YSLLAVGDLHATVRSYLRRRWRLPGRPEVVDQVIAQLRAVADGLELPGRPGEPEYMEALGLRLNVRAWADEGEALGEFASALALGESTRSLVDLATEIRDVGRHGRVSRALQKLRARLEDAPWGVEAWGSDEVLTWLEQEERQGRWTPVQQGALGLLRGLR